MAKNKPTELDELIAEGVGVVQQLERLGQNRKLTASAFLAEAIEFADTTREEVEKLGVDLETKLGTDYANAFVSKLVRVFRESNYPRCPNDPGSVLNCYGSNEAFQQLTSLGATVAQAIALAVMRVHQKFGDDAFGVTKNWDKYVKEYTNLRYRLAGIYEEMKGAVCGLDLDTNTEGLFQEEIARGLCRTSFRKAPGIGPHQGDWPRELVAACANAPKKAANKKRERLGGRKKAA